MSLRPYRKYLVRFHSAWEKTARSQWGLSTKYVVWVCRDCGFETTQPDDLAPEKFELGPYEWDCDRQLVKRIMES